MAKSRKQQRTARGAVANAAETVKETVVDVAKATTRIAENYVVEPVKKVLGLGKKKPIKKRHVRPNRQASAAGPSPLVRGKSSSAKTMSAGIAKSMPILTTAESAVSSKPVSAPANGGFDQSDLGSSRSNRRRANRRTSEG